MDHGRAGGSRVLVVTPWYPTRADPIGGIFVRDHALAAATHHDVRVLHVDLDHAVRDRSVEPPAVVRQWVRPRRPGVRVVSVSFFFLVALVRLLVRHRFRPDLIHGHVHVTSRLAWVASRILRCPWVQTEHSSGFEEGTVGARELRRTRWAYARANRVLPVSAHLRSTLEGCGIDARFEVVWNTVDVEEFRPPSARLPGPVRFLAVGLMDEGDRKNVVGLLDAIAGMPGGTLTLAGDGLARSRHEARARELGIDGRVDFVGRVPRAEVADLMRSHDVLVHAAPIETFSMVVAEALATGMYVVGTPTGVIPDLVELTGNGIIVRTEAELAAAIAGARDADHDPRRRADVAASARPVLCPDRLRDDLDRIYGEVSAMASRR